jgi:hypothetical protein
MKTWVWVLLLVAIVLFLWTVRREGFQQTAKIKGPPYGGCTDFKEDGTCRTASDYDLIVGMMPTTLVAALKTKNNAGVAPTAPLASASAAEKAGYQSSLTAYNKKLVDGIISDTMGEFYSTIYQPASTAITAARVDTFMFEYPGQIKATSPPAFMFLVDNKAGVSTLLTEYFVKQPAGAANAALTTAQVNSANASAASGYDAILAALGQGPAGATGATGGSGSTGSTGTSGNTTGGSSTTASANSGTNKGNIFGPAFTGFGTNSGGSGGMGARDYPTLIGPKPQASKYVEGAGVMNLSQSENLAKSGVLPGAAETGSDPASRFFGSSRVPGDRDLIPDAGQQFTPSIGSSKTEPVPYLADFSAFAT